MGLFPSTTRVFQVSVLFVGPHWRATVFCHFWPTQSPQEIWKALRWFPSNVIQSCIGCFENLQGHFVDLSHKSVSFYASHVLLLRDIVVVIWLQIWLIQWPAVASWLSSQCLSIMDVSSTNSWVWKDERIGCPAREFEQGTWNQMQATAGTSSDCAVARLDWD